MSKPEQWGGGKAGKKQQQGPNSPKTETARANICYTANSSRGHFLLSCERCLFPSMKSTVERPWCKGLFFCLHAGLVETEGNVAACYDRIRVRGCSPASTSPATQPFFFWDQDLGSQLRRAKPARLPAFIDRHALATQPHQFLHLLIRHSRMFDDF